MPPQRILTCRITQHNFVQDQSTVGCCVFNCPLAATVLNSVQPQLQTVTQAVFQPQSPSIQTAAVHQMTCQPTQVSSAQVTAGQVTAAQVTSASTTISQPSLSVATLQTAGISINPAIVRIFTVLNSDVFFYLKKDL